MFTKGNRWRRLQLSDEMRKEVSPKNILMIGPTGVGKTGEYLFFYWRYSVIKLNKKIAKKLREEWHNYPMHHLSK